MFHRKRRLRVQDEHDVGNLAATELHGKEIQCKNVRTSCNPKFVSRVFSEEYQNIRGRAILDPQSPAACLWNEIFLAVSLLSLFVDPLYLLSPYSAPELCIEASNRKFDLVLTVVRSLLDFFSLVNVVIQFRTAYVAASSRVLGRGELVIDPRKIALRYLGGAFWLDVLAMLPVPQVIIWGVIPNLNGSETSLSKTALRFSILLQFILRLVMMYPLQSKISKATGAMPKRAWTGATYNMMFYYLLSNVAGASYYLLALLRQESCWRKQCNQESGTCKYIFMDCSSMSDPKRSMWLALTNMTNICDANNDFYDFGTFQAALQVGATSATFLRKYFYCFWWGLQSLSSVGNNLETSSNMVENIFTNLVAILGMILFGLLIGNVQMYIESGTKRRDQCRIKGVDTERWMHHRQLSPILKHSVRCYDQYKWVATRGVDEEELLRDLPPNLKRKVNRHLWFNLLRQVPLFKEMDDHLLDAICERLKPTLSIEGAVLLREGDPVTKMLFIIRGYLGSSTMTDGQTRLFTSTCLGPGNFCGEELLTWALDPQSTTVLPPSTRTVKASSKVEALGLTPEDLKYVASQFRKLHSRQVVHNLRFHSHQWRTWAACYIQAAWHRYKRRRASLLAQESSQDQTVPEESEIFLPQPGSGFAAYAAEMVRRIRRGSSNRFGPDSCTTSYSSFEF